MEFSDICKAFYISQGRSGFKNHKSKKKIAMHLIKLAVKEETQDALRQSESTFINWADGDSSPREDVWANFREKYIEADYVKGLKESFSDTYINEVAIKLGITVSSGENVNKNKFALAIAKQMKAIADGNNQDVEDIVRKTYVYQDTEVSFFEYKSKAIDRYNKMKLIGGKEVPLEDYFVCNTIGDSQRFMTDISQYKGVCLDNARVESIRSIFKDSGKKQYKDFDNKRCILIGSGGSGKTLMLQHLFLAAADEYPASGILPVFLELRDFVQSETVESFLLKTVSQKDPSFKKEISEQMLSEGKCVILMDGIDEIDPNDIGDFQRKLEAFTDKYKDIQIILSSRMCDAVIGLKGYVPLYVWPFRPEQAERLIDKILIAEEKTNAREAILEYLHHGFLGNESVFAKHPMLLTFIARNYPSFDRFKENRVLFYRKAYEALLSGHDDNKKPYDRVFHSVDNADQFSIVFREFCGRTYSKGALSFTDTSFDLYFNELTSYKKFENPHKMTVRSFKHDACATACMMYEKELDLWYIDPGFQEFLFAEYYAQAEKEEVIELQQSLSRIPYAQLLRFDALDMLYNASEIKFKMYVLLPFLDTIFKGSDEEAFMNFLAVCFDKVNIVEFDEIVKALFLQNLGIKDMLVPNVENHPNSILLDYILKMIGEDHDYEYTLYSKDNIPIDGGIKKLNVTEDMEMTGVLIGQSVDVGGVKRLLIDCKPRYVYDHFNTQEQKGEQTGYFVDEEKRLIPFGAEYTIDSYYLSNNASDYKELVENVITNSADTYGMFQRIKSYYKALRLEKHHSGLK